jgi:hypothetical protein
MLVDILRDTASDAGSTPAASTIFRIRHQHVDPQSDPQTSAVTAGRPELWSGSRGAAVATEPSIPTAMEGV